MDAWVVAIPAVLLMTVAVYTDLRHRLIYNWLTLPGIAYFLVVYAILTPGQWFHHLLGVVLLGGITLMMALVSKGQIGGGDIKLFAMVGAAMGWQAGFPAMVWTYLLAALFVVLLWFGHLILKQKKQVKELPMAPFIAGGMALQVLFSAQDL